MIYNNADFLIFGGTGSLGKKLIERLISGHKVVVYSRDEAKHWTIKNEIANGPLQEYSHNLTFAVGDIRDPARVRDVIFKYNPTTIIIAAALKQVDTCELNPNESMLTNLIGTQNVINATNDVYHLLQQHRLTNVLFVSTDKACSPINVYGMCKALSERVVTSQLPSVENTFSRRGIKYLCVRYGNVLDSRGSIIPLFRHQAVNASHLTVTNPDMTRFVMTLDDSVDLILAALKHGSSGETWIPKLPAMKIGDLAEVFSEQFSKPIKIVGLRPGEKMHEDLVNETESSRTYTYVADSGVRHYVIKPSYTSVVSKKFTYSSNDIVMTKEQLSDHLTKLGLITMPLDKFPGLTIEEIKEETK